MFTGIVEELGTIDRFEGGTVRITATQVIEDAAIGDSIAVNGCCLTVVALGPDWWEADVSDETVRRTGFSGLGPGDPVNLERAVRAGDRLGGHLVQGHVDGVGHIVDPVPDLRIAIPAPLRRYVVEKGSITVDGVSLTVVEPTDDGFTVAIIPHTASVTTLGRRRPGDEVNIEVDAIAKYVEQLLRPHLGPVGDDPAANRSPDTAPGATP